jgi:hypothetical protein
MADDPYARIAELEAEVAALRADAGRRDRTLAEVLEHQVGTSEILRVIAASSANLSGVLEAVAQSAMRLSFSVSANVVIRAVLPPPPETARMRLERRLTYRSAAPGQWRYEKVERFTSQTYRPRHTGRNSRTRCLLRRRPI